MSPIPRMCGPGSQEQVGYLPMAQIAGKWAQVHYLEVRVMMTPKAGMQ